MATKNAVATVEEKPNAVIPADMLDMLAQDSGAGLEHVKIEDLPIPYMRILQPLSPQVNKRNVEYVDGAEAGQIMNTATLELQEDFIFIPCVYQRRFTKWTPRDKGGGLVKDWGPDDSILKQCDKKEGKGNIDFTPAGNVLSTDATFFGLVYPQMQRAIVSMTSTQLKKARRWVAQATGLQVKVGDKTITPPLFYMAYALSSLPEKNEKGEWFGWTVKPFGPVPEMENGTELYLAARAFRDEIEKGLVKVNVDQDDANRGVNDKDIPF